MFQSLKGVGDVNLEVLVLLPILMIFSIFITVLLAHQLVLLRLLGSLVAILTLIIVCLNRDSGVNTVRSPDLCEATLERLLAPQLRLTVCDLLRSQLLSQTIDLAIQMAILVLKPPDCGVLVLQLDVSFILKLMQSCGFPIQSV